MNYIIDLIKETQNSGDFLLPSAEFYSNKQFMD